MRNYIEIQTTPEVTAVLWAAHRKELTVFESYTDPDGTCPMGNGSSQMDTAWGFEGAQTPLFRTVHTWDMDKDYKRKNEIVIHTLCVAIDVED